MNGFQLDVIYAILRAKGRAIVLIPIKNHALIVTISERASAYMTREAIIFSQVS